MLNLILLHNREDVSVFNSIISNVTVKYLKKILQFKSQKLSKNVYDKKIQPGENADIFRMRMFLLL